MDSIEIIEEKKDKKKSRNKKKYHLWEKILIISSVVFITTCIIFYGTRLVKYYKIYNPKIDNETGELIMNAIVRNSKIVYEGDGLYRVSGMYIYKGENVDNYIRYSNMTWRIIKFNSDGSLDLVLDDNINMLKWDNQITPFDESDIYKYLNNYFYKLLNYNYLSNTVICNDMINDLNSMTCNDKKTDSYVRLLNISEYLNSKVEGTYINTNENIWLANRSEDAIWNINNGNLSSSEPTNMYYIRPVITIKNSTPLLSGTGSKEDPYIIEENQLGIGSYIKLGNDTWYIYNKENDFYRLSLTSLLETKKIYNNSSTKFDIEKNGTLANYLNTEYYDSLTYKEKLLEVTWYDGNYDSYNDVFSSSVKATVGILNVNDIKVPEIDGYYLMTPSSEDRIYLYSATLLDSNPNLLRGVVPTIAIRNLNVVSGTGTRIDPYIIEV